MATDNEQTDGEPAGARILCLTGPESTGKTTLSGLLAERLGGALVPEVARNYLTGRTGYTADDVLEIARRQVAREAEALTDGARFLICDTDLTVIQVWWEEKYGALPTELEDMLAARSARSYLLLAADLPWEPDPLRENPRDLVRLFDRYQALLESGVHPYRVISGVGDARLVCALEAVGALLPELVG